MATQNRSLQRAVRHALLASAAGAAVVALPAQAQDSTIQEVVVTGSRISTPNMTSISPVTAIAAEDIAATGKMRVEDIINQLPQAMAAQGSTISNGSTGTATVDLRGLNAKRTLVLINGRRLMPGNPDTAPGVNSGAPDLNQIPKALIERVEVLTGGASSVYGADAVAGVVNFILNTRFEGVKVEGNYSFYNHENDNPVADVVRTRGYELPKSDINTGYSKDFSFVMGSNFADDRGNATFYATYTDVKPILQAEFDYSACTFNSGDVFTCGGSGTTDPPRMRARNPVTGELTPYHVVDRNTGAFREYDSDARHVQLRSAELLSASGRALHRRRVHRPGNQRRPDRVRRVHVHEGPLDRADRAERRVRPGDGRVVQQPAAERRAGAAVLRPVRAVDRA